MTPIIYYDGIPIQNARRKLNDSIYVPNFVNKVLGIDLNSACQQINIQAPWVSCYTNELKICEAVWLRGEGCCKCQCIPRMHQTPLLLEIANNLQKLTFDKQKPQINQAIAERYEKTSDPTWNHDGHSRTDIISETYCFDITLGKPRILHYRWKERNRIYYEEKIVLNPGDLFIHGPITKFLYQRPMFPINQRFDIEIQPCISLFFQSFVTEKGDNEVERPLPK